ncbi:MAG: UDP-3-O-(3-hydroxymyristoyl)glucosamine N-acyltransferase [Trueperaceae bacterium]|nr:UDP-3-O-(3-hydroxymyristoyl)glucosamine N-acyltransferase [Trueperaceae bacterium]
MTRRDPPTLAAIAEYLGARLDSDRPEMAVQPVRSLASPERPQAGSVVVLNEVTPELIDRLEAHGVLAVVVEEGLEPPTSLARIYVRDPRLAFAVLTSLFRPPPPPPDISPAASIDPSARLGTDVAVSAGAVIEADAMVGAGSRIGAGSVVGRGATLGANVVLHANVSLYPGVTLGDRVVIHSGAVIGADGFGYALGPRGAAKIEHLGTVVLEDDVEIGANSCIDRATLDETRIGARTKIDNLCTIAHNVVVGCDGLILGAAVIAGSVRIGDRVIIGGGALLRDHIVIGDDVRVVGNSGVTKDVPAGETWAGFPAKPFRSWTRDLYLLGQLERIWQAVRGWQKQDENGV